jgi:HrpA-like RNA helicase
MAINLFLKERAGLFRKFQTPEMLRVPLDELCLTIKALGMGDITQVPHPL